MIDALVTNARDPRAIKQVDEPYLYVDASAVNDVRIFSSAKSLSKYFIVWTNPSGSAVHGDQLSSFFTKVRSGWRCFGSSGGSGSRIIRERELVSSMTR